MIFSMPQSDRVGYTWLLTIIKKDFVLDRATKTHISTTNLHCATQRTLEYYIHITTTFPLEWCPTTQTRFTTFTKAISGFAANMRLLLIVELLA